MGGPKLFVSYSWSSPEHEARVLQLATDLRDSGVDAILDKWDLREGHDAHAFMEKIVTDPDVKKVILVCDKMYAEKTDARRGGVGKEAQIISSEIYEKQAQDKFVAVVVERDPDGRPYLPVYYRSRIYIDLSDPATYADNFDQLLRWVFDKPLYQKPDLGKRPEFLQEGNESINLGTSSRVRRALEAVRAARDNAIPLVSEYLTFLSERLETIRLDPAAEPFDEAVVKSIDAFLPYRNEFIELLAAIALYRDAPELRITLHRFFERLIPYLDRPAHVHGWNESDFDNFRFIIHELFLYAIAVMLKHERFESAAYLLGSEYYAAGGRRSEHTAMLSFEEFRKPLKSLSYRNDRLNLQRLSLHADLLEQRAKGMGVELRHLMQADFVAFIRNTLVGGSYWWPVTLLYVGRHSGPFEMFARARSLAYFDRIKVVFGVKAKDDLNPLMDDFRSGKMRLPQWQFESFNPEQLMGFSELATKP